MSKERVELIAEMLKAGKFQTDIATELGVSRQRIQQVAKKLGLTYVKKPWKRREGSSLAPAAKISKEIAKQIRELFAEQTPLKDLAEKFHVSRATIWATLRGRIWVDAGGPIVEKVSHPKANPERREVIWRMHESGKTNREISKAFDVHESYISQLLKKIRKTKNENTDTQKTEVSSSVGGTPTTA